MPRSVRFRAKIRKEAINPYIDVPVRGRRAFAPWTKAGRVHVEGTLGKASMRATLVPKGGRLRLYVNGGMRAAAGVGVGDTVDVSLRAVGKDEASTPADLKAALRKAGVSRAYENLGASHRRELVRWIDDARTASSRKTRIDDTVAQVGGGDAPRRGRTAEDKPLWFCPKCGNPFVTRNLNHSCHRHAIGDCFRGKPAEIQALFDRFRDIVEACGPVRLLPYRDRVGFMVKVRFAGATPRPRWLDIGFWLPRRLESPRFRKIETITPTAHIHWVRITDPAQLDPELAGWIREAYAVGCRMHLAGATR